MHVSVEGIAGEIAARNERRRPAAAGCKVCGQAIPKDEGPADFRQVVLDNGRVLRTCLFCWTLWPSAHKRYPSWGYGRTSYGPSTAALIELRREICPPRSRPLEWEEPAPKEWIGEEPPAVAEKRAA